MHLCIKKFLYLMLVWLFLFLPASFAAEKPTDEDAENVVAEEDLGTSEDIFGDDRRLFHFEGDVSFIYSDNIFSSGNRKEDDFITTLSPKVWVAFPANKDRITSFTTSDRSPGGWDISRYKTENLRKYQFYFAVDPVFQIYSQNSVENSDTYSFEGNFQYNFNKVSIDILDNYYRGGEIDNTKTATLTSESGELSNNLFNTVIKVDISEKMNMRFDYSNYDVQHDLATDNFMERNDNSLSAFLFYKFWQKTSLFVQYKFNMIEYDTNNSLDSDEHLYKFGVNWDITAKTTGQVSVGYGEKQFENALKEDLSDFTVSAEVSHIFTPKTSIAFTVFRGYNETNDNTYDGTVINYVNISYSQKITPKIVLSLGAYGSMEDYEKSSQAIPDREDEEYIFRAGVAYEFRKWLTMDLKYEFKDNNSNLDDFDYSLNKIMLGFHGKW